MKVLCIDDSKKMINGVLCKNDIEPVKEGKLYYVMIEKPTPSGQDGYLLKGFTVVKHQSRFIPISYKC